MLRRMVVADLNSANRELKTEINNFLLTEVMFNQQNM